MLTEDLNKFRSFDVETIQNTTKKLPLGKFLTAALAKQWEINWTHYFSLQIIIVVNKTLGIMLGKRKQIHKEGSEPMIVPIHAKSKKSFCENHPGIRLVSTGSQQFTSAVLRELSSARDHVRDDTKDCDRIDLFGKVN